MTFRKLILFFHRWFGLIAGLHFVLLGLTGSWIVYMDQIETILKPALKAPSRAEPMPDWAEAIFAAQQGLQTDKLPIGIRVPEEGLNLGINFDISVPGGERKIATAFVDPATNEYRGQEVRDETLSGKIFEFHHDLFWGRTGRAIMAVSGILMVIILIGGAYLWIPRPPRGFWSGFQIHRVKNAFQLNLDIHKLTGIYTLVLMFAVTASGVVISRSDWFVKTPPPEKGIELEGAVDLSRLKHAVDSLELPPRPMLIRLNTKSSTAFISSPAGRKAIDLATYRPKELPPLTSAQQFRALNHDIHGGHFWGKLGGLLIFVSGLLPLGFYITGFYVWWKKN